MVSAVAECRPKSGTQIMLFRQRADYDEFPRFIMQDRYAFWDSMHKYLKMNTSVREGDTVSTIRPLKINKLQSSSFALCYRDVSQSELNCARRSRMDFIVNLAPRNFRDLFHSELAWLAKAIREEPQGEKRKCRNFNAPAMPASL